MAEKHHLQGEQLRMFIPAKELMEHRPLDTVGASTFHEAHGMLGRKRDKIKTYIMDNQQTMTTSITNQGVQKPVELQRVSQPREEWAVLDGHHRTIAAYDVNPDMEVPVIYHNYEPPIP